MSRETLLRRIFAAGVDSVRPQTIFRARDIVKVVDNKEIQVLNGDNRITIDFPARTHVIGFGKGVFGLALEMERILGEHLVSGQINVPVSSELHFHSHPLAYNPFLFQVNTIKTNALCQMPKIIKVVEAAANNLPDEDAVEATRKIRAFAGTLTEQDVLFVLITGGGSALLPLPCEGVTLDEKLDVIKSLVRKGATIQELNEVRIQLSDIKGGKLAHAASGARQIISLIISDIVNDPIALIASGPTTVEQEEKENNGRKEAVDILKSHDVWPTLSDNVQQAIIVGQAAATARANTMAGGGGERKKMNVENILIANNYLAVDGCLKEIERQTGDKKKITGVYLSNAVTGDVAQVSQGFFELGQEIKEAMRNKRQLDDGKLSTCLRKLSIEKESRFIAELNAALLSGGGDVCLVAGGETTVTIEGKGAGGRNQQMVMEFMKLCQDEQLDGVYLLSSGTDGIDGPTDAAGAVGSLELLREQFREVEREGIKQKIEENDSYNFFKSKPCHLVIGHTGTNVMDIQLLMICNE